MNRHLSDDEIQQYAADKSKSSVLVRKHIETCGECRHAVVMYEAVFSHIKDMPKPAFDFDLSMLVMEPLARQASRNKWAFTLTVVVILSIAVLALITGLKFAFKALPPVSQILNQLLAVTMAVVMIFQLVEVYRKYRRKLKSLLF